MRHLVTGGSGYVGSFIVKELNSMDEEVISLDVIPPLKKIANVTYIEESVINEKRIYEITKDIDYIHHNAALVPLTKNNKDFQEINVEGTKILVKNAIKNNIKHFCHMSSSAVFGLPIELPLTNNSKRSPVEIYGQSKKDAEDFVLSSIASNPRFSCSIIRPRTILGTERLGIFELLFRWISEGKDIFVIGKANQPFQFAHINDIVNASINSCLYQKRGVFNIGTLEFNSLTSDLNNLIKFSGNKSRIRHLPEKLSISGLTVLDKLGLSPFAPWHYLTYHKPFYFDSNYVFKELDYKPYGSNLELLKESYNSFLKNKRLKMKENKFSSPHNSKLKARLLDKISSISTTIPF